MMYEDNTEVIIVAAGEGKRMKDLGRQLPKSLIDINGVVLIDRILRLASKVVNHESRIHIVVGHRKELIVGYLGYKYPNNSFNIIHNEFYNKLSNSRSLDLGWYHRKLPNPNLLIIDADTYLSIESINEIYDYIKKYPTQSQIFVSNHKSAKGEWEIIPKYKYTNSGGMIDHIETANPQEGGFITTGIVYFSKEDTTNLMNYVCTHLESSKYWDDAYLQKDILTNMHFFNINSYIREVDSVEDIQKIADEC